MVSSTVKIKNGSIPLPNELRKEWNSAEIFITGEKDSLLIKKIQKPSLKTLRPMLKELGKRISQTDIEAAIREVRSK